MLYKHYQVSKGPWCLESRRSGPRPGRTIQKMGDQHAERNGNNDSGSNNAPLVENPGQDGEAGQEGPSNPPSQDEEIVDGEAQARFMQRALSESARLRRQADILCVVHPRRACARLLS